MVGISPNFTQEDILEIKNKILKKVIRHEELNGFELNFIRDYPNIIQLLNKQNIKENENK